MNATYINAFGTREDQIETLIEILTDITTQPKITAIQDGSARVGVREGRVYLSWMLTAQEAAMVAQVLNNEAIDSELLSELQKATIKNRAYSLSV